MKRRTDVVIVGSGITGLSIAYSLVNKGCKDIVILEKGHLSSGASTRNGGGVRAQFATEENIILSKWSIQRFKQLSLELDTNFWFRQGGYVFIAESEDELSLLKKAVEFQNAYGLGTRIVDCDMVQDLIPRMVCTSVVGGAFRKGDGILFPFPLLFGYAEWLRKNSVSIETHCQVEGVKRDSMGFSVKTSRGTIEADRLVNASGGWSNVVAKMLNVDVPTKPVRHQIMASEPMSRFLDPMVVTLRDGFYVGQGPRGELVGGVTESGTHGEDPGRSSHGFCAQLSKRLVGLFPDLSSARMMRQWAGFYDMSPDANPILDSVPGVENAYIACGFSGHGFMISPAVGEFMANLILGEKPLFPTEPYRLDRFVRGLSRSETLVIG